MHDDDIIPKHDERRYTPPNVNPGARALLSAAAAALFTVALVVVLVGLVIIGLGWAIAFAASFF